MCAKQIELNGSTVAGYVVVNHVSSKQSNGASWIKQQRVDNLFPVGDVLVTPEDIPDPQDLRLTKRVNGQLQYDENTSHMIYGVARIIEELSSHVTLRPGTLVMTGTPSGVAMGRKPSNLLKVNVIL